jgi:hypothetical protein
MNFLKRFFSKKGKNNNYSIVKKDANSSIVESTLALGHTNNIEFNYQNNLAWWISLPEDWKRMFLSPNSCYELDMSVDITIQPSEEFLTSILRSEVFCSNWIPIKSLSSLNAMKNLKKLLIESVGVKNFNEISSMKNITTIHAGFSKLESLEGLENFEYLEQITLANTDITSLKPIASLKKINDLDIRGTLINPNEYDLFKQLHPLARIDFITPMNPLRRSKDSLENSLLDYYRNLIKD